MLSYERPKLGEAEHFTMGVMRLYQSVGVEESAVAPLEHYLLLLIAHRRHESKGHPPGPQLLGFTVTVQVRQVVACVGVAQASALRVEDCVEEGHEHVG